MFTKISNFIVTVCIIIFDKHLIRRLLNFRGLPYELENEELEQEFKKFGELKYALICRYKDSEMSKGSGFVQYVEKADADRCLKQANEVFFF